MDSFQRRKIRRQDPASADEQLEQALLQALTTTSVDGKVRVQEQESKSLQSSPKGDGKASSGNAEQPSASNDHVTLAVVPSSGIALGDGTPEQTPHSHPPSSPFSPHPFWSEKAKAEAELAFARPSSLDEEAKKLAQGPPQRPAGLDHGPRLRSGVTVDEEIKEPRREMLSVPPQPEGQCAIEDGQLAIQAGAMVSGGSTALALPSAGTFQPAASSRSDLSGPMVSTQSTGEQVQRTVTEPSVEIVQPEARSSRELYVPGASPDDHLFEITRLRSLVEHLSERLEKCEEAKSFGSASSGRVQPSDLEAAAQAAAETFRPPRLPLLPSSPPPCSGPSAVLF